MIKPKVNQFPSINVQERAIVAGQQSYSWMGCSIEIERTPGTLGGWLQWFLCPDCRRRKAILYAVRQGQVSCRCCLGLAYPCQRETAADRALRRAEKIRRRLGWERGIGNPGSGRPKGMRWKTYWRMVDEHNKFALVFMRDWAARLHR